MACKARDCSWSRVYHASRIEEHLLDCQLANSEFPTMLRDLGRAPDGDPLLPGVPPEWLPGVQLAFLEAILRSAVPFGTFDSPLWRTVLTRVSHGLFTGPRTRQAVSGWMLDKVADKYFAAMTARIVGATSYTLSNDGWTDLRSRELYNFIVCLPLSLFVSTFSLGVGAATAEALLERLTAEVAALDALLAAARTAAHPAAAGGAAGGEAGGEAGGAAGGAADDVTWWGEAAATYTRLLELAKRSAWGLVTDSPNVMVRVRQLARAAGLAIVAIGCADHAINFVTHDGANVEPFGRALRETTRVAVFFKRFNRARAILAAALTDLRALGRGVANMVTFSESRWCGIHLTVESVRRCLPALQAVINGDQKSAKGFDVSPAVAACILDPAFGQGLAAASPFLAQMFDCTRFLEADAAPMSSFVAAIVFLWLLLDGVRVAGIPAASRSYLRDRLSARFKRTVDCHVALAFYLDPFWAPMWGRAGSVSFGGKTMVEWRDQSLDEMAGTTDGALRAELSREMHSFMRAHRPMMVPKAEECLHPVGY